MISKIVVKSLREDFATWRIITRMCLRNIIGPYAPITAARPALTDCPKTTGKRDGLLFK
jgi:hypothetical protein